MSFGSDNQYGAHPLIIDAIAKSNIGILPSYGADLITKKAIDLIAKTFETDDFDIYFVPTGGAANCLAIACLCPNWGAVICHSHAHIIADEGNGPERISGGARLIGIGNGPKLMAQDIEIALKNYSQDFVHGPQPKLVSITNLNENGLYYSSDEIKQIAKICQDNGLLLHCDGARFANAIIANGETAKDLSWGANIDALSFGLTKNGAIMAEALMIFGKARNKNAAYIQKTAQALISKNRFFAAQYIAMLENNLWLELATNANKAANSLIEIFKQKQIEIVFESKGNEIFVKLNSEMVKKLETANIGFYPWHALGQDIYRFVCSWATNEQEIENLKQALEN